MNDLDPQESKLEIARLTEARGRLAKAAVLVDEAVSGLIDAGLADHANAIWLDTRKLISEINTRIDNLKAGKP